MHFNFLNVLLAKHLLSRFTIDSFKKTNTLHTNTLCKWFTVRKWSQDKVIVDISWKTESLSFLKHTTIILPWLNTATMLKIRNGVGNHFISDSYRYYVENTKRSDLQFLPLLLEGEHYNFRGVGTYVPYNHITITNTKSAQCTIY